MVSRYIYIFTSSSFFFQFCDRPMPVTPHSSLGLSSRSLDQSPQGQIINNILTSLEIVFEGVKFPSQRVVPQIQLIISSEHLRVAIINNENIIIRGRRTREYEAKMSLTKVAIRVGSSKFWAVTELIANRGWRLAIVFLPDLYGTLG